MHIKNFIYTQFDQKSDASVIFTVLGPFRYFCIRPTSRAWWLYIRVRLSTPSR